MITSDEYVQPRVFHTLDALRGIAAIAVVVFHSATVLAPISMPTAYLAVDIFFVMSGIVIAHAYEVQLLTRNWYLVSSCCCVGRVFIRSTLFPGQ